MIAYREIERRLTSLTDRTNKRIALRGETWEFRGVNSPYVSHQRVALSEGHGVEGLVTFGEGFLFVAASGHTFVGAISRPLPAFHVRGLFQFPATAPEWLLPREGREPIVLVAYPDCFTGYNDEGRPMFNGDPDVFLSEGNNSRLIIKKSHLTILSQHPETSRHQIGCQEVLLNPTLGQFYAPELGRVYRLGESFKIPLRDETIEEVEQILKKNGLMIRCGMSYRYCYEHKRDCDLCEGRNVWEVVDAASH